MKRESIPGWRELRTLEEAVDLLDEWRRHATRLDAEIARMRWRIEYLESLLEHLDPFLPQMMQNPELRRRYPEHYRAIGELKANPFA